MDDMYVTNYSYASEVPSSTGVALFPYASSTLFQDKLLSLTDADFAYKVDLVGISTETKAIGTYPKLTIQGINSNQS